MDGASKRYQALVGYDFDAPRMNLGVTLERLLDLRLDIRGEGRRFERDFVRDSAYAPDVSDGSFHFSLLALPFDGASQRDPAIADLNFDAAVGGAITVKRVHGRPRDILIAAFSRSRHLDLDLVSSALTFATRMAARSAATFAA